MRLLPCGDRAVLIDVEDTRAAVRWAAAVREAAQSTGLPVVDVVPAAASVLVTCGRDDLATVRAAIMALMPVAGIATGTHPGTDVEVTIDVIYDGADLDDVAAYTGLTPTEVVAAHTGTPWTVAFTGFAPGFGYLTGGDPRLAVPRRETSRTRVPAGSVALAGEFSGVYPRESPGGWQLIGHTDAVLWDEHRDQHPALLRPGVTVRFRAVGP